MSSDTYSDVTIDAPLLEDKATVTVWLHGSEDASVSVSGLCLYFPALDAIRAVEPILRGESVGIAKFFEYPRTGEGGSILSVVEDDVRYICSSSELIKTNRSDEGPEEPLSSVSVEERYPVTSLALAEAILELGEAAREAAVEAEYTTFRSDDESERSRVLETEDSETRFECPDANRYDRFNRVVLDASDAVRYYEAEGTLEGFERSRGRPELERFLYYGERLPGTEEYVRNHDVIQGLLEDLLGSDLSDEVVEEYLQWAVQEPDRGLIPILEALGEIGDPRAVAAWQPWSFEPWPEVLRAGARMLAGLEQTERVRRNLKEGLEMPDEETNRIVAEALED